MLLEELHRQVIFLKPSPVSPHTSQVHSLGKGCPLSLNLFPPSHWLLLNILFSARSNLPGPPCLKNAPFLKKPSSVCSISSTLFIPACNYFVHLWLHLLIFYFLHLDITFVETDTLSVWFTTISPGPRTMPGMK